MGEIVKKMLKFIPIAQESPHPGTNFTGSHTTNTVTHHILEEIQPANTNAMEPVVRHTLLLYCTTMQVVGHEVKRARAWSGAWSYNVKRKKQGGARERESSKASHKSKANR